MIDVGLFVFFQRWSKNLELSKSQSLRFNDSIIAKGFGEGKYCIKAQATIEASKICAILGCKEKNTWSILQ